MAFDEYSGEACTRNIERLQKLISQLSSAVSQNNKSLPKKSHRNRTHCQLFIPNVEQHNFTQLARHNFVILAWHSLTFPPSPYINVKRDSVRMYVYTICIILRLCSKFEDSLHLEVWL